jgi:hypothetical protein
MKYICLVYGDEQELEAMPEAELNALMEECRDYVESLRERGRCLAAEQLRPIHTATTLRVRKDRVSVTDGPFAETKEQLGGFYLIEARDLNDAIRTASRIPSARLGAIEIRPVREAEAP